MATLKWTEDYGQYKKGETFENNDAGSTKYLVESGKVEVVSKENHITTVAPAETADAPKAETATATKTTTTSKKR